ncbi:phenylacetate--CoA ligase family protein [Roseiconus nitratireducens]|uniref:Phenylacetate--CoA ligase family protein n=1 Tax=Roseiconus nitratireducens TaxID=2605748 RepID=A0A5M6DJ44_9BACT|nr:phenylacetate--CoA ligase family protein [Roseiconus nitratireducens]KAA5546272.1 phenylacetate--CoA ligase family protein [Roseiconus nitratireducens]
MINFHQAIFRAGVAIRNRQIPSHRAFLLESQWWSLEKLREWQESLLREIVQNAYEHSVFYRVKFDDSGLEPQQIKTLDDLASLPILEKNEILSERDRLQIRDGGERLFYSETSGSTGNPLVFYRNADWDAWHNASVMRGYEWHGVRPWERNGYLWGFNFSPSQRLKTRALDALQNRFRMFSYDDDEIASFAGKLRHAVYLGGYSSMIYEIAKAINRNPRIEPLTNLKLIRGTSEKIFERYQQEAVQAFGRRIVSEYGAAESGIIAFECPEGSMHVNMETCIVEVENGEILVTNLVSRSFPIIRYRLGDSIVLDREMKCACGRAHPVIREVTGRIGKRIVGKSRSFPSLTLYYVFKNLARKHDLVLNYQGVQEQAGVLRLDIEEKVSSETRVLLLGECEAYYGKDVDVEIRESCNLRSQGRKKRDFVSSIDDGVS